MHVGNCVETIWVRVVKTKKVFKFIKFHAQFKILKLLTNFKKWLGYKKMFMLIDNDENCK